MKITILTIFPEFFTPYLSWGIVKRSIDDGSVEIKILNIRDYAKNKHQKVDDYPFGGGAGMLMSVQPLFDSIQDTSGRRIHLSPRGKTLDDSLTKDLAREEEIVLICSHYEGMDQRVIDHFTLEEISIGDYVLSGGELSALVLMDAILRKVEGFITEDSLEEESFTNGLLEYDQYTRPREYQGLEVPEILLSGHHQKIKEYQLENAVRNTMNRRMDLIEKGLKEESFSREVLEMINKIEKENRNE